MPFYVHPKDVDPFDPLSDGYPFDTYNDRASAHTHASARGYTVTFRCNADERYRWRDRELGRFSSGGYLPVPWGDKIRAECLHHFAHISVKKPGMIAYTPSDEHGVQDRQVAIKPGRYLTEFYEKDGYFSHDDVQRYCDAVTTAHETATLHIARTPEDIVRIYRGEFPAPQSCMAPGPSLRDNRHPCEVYGNSDLGVAYYGPIGAVNARAVVWPDKKVYGRVYGTHDDGHVGTNGAVLIRLLKEAGYQPGGLDGARIRNVDYRGSYLIPYIDGIDYARESGQWLILGEGSIDAGSTSGYASMPDEPEDDDDYYDDNRATCDHCGDRYNLNDYGSSDNYCAECEEDRWTCELCDDEYFNDRHQVYVEAISETWCTSCYRAHVLTCADENCSNMFVPQEFDDDETKERERCETSDLCADCAERYWYCETCEQSTDSLPCDTCGRYPRCEHTRALPLMSTSDANIASMTQLAEDDERDRQYTSTPVGRDVLNAYAHEHDLPQLPRIEDANVSPF